MQVSLIDYTGFGHPDPLFAARKLAYTKNTRLEQVPSGFGKFEDMPVRELMEELGYVANTIRSSWEFVGYTFQVTGVTRAYTHQQVRTRVGVSFAQQAQRVVDMGGFEHLMPDTVKEEDTCEAQAVWDSVMRTISQGYQRLQELGIPNQDSRGLLPTNVLTNIIIQVNLRTLADLLGKRKNLRAQGEYADVVLAMEQEVLKVHPWAKDFLDPPRLQTPALDALLKAALAGRAPIDAPEVNAALKEFDALKGTWG
jgi:thymidylate synthase (FAD)